MIPISETIRNRILAASSKFFCNDNISKYINEGELDLLVNEVSDKFQNVLESLIIDTSIDHNTKDTAKRVAKMMVLEIFSGRYIDPPSITSFPNTTEYDQLYITGPITIRSTCAHHFQPIYGKCYIGIFPDKKVIGLSKFNRIIDWIASRPSIQEELTMQIADEIEKETEAKGVAVVIKAEHFCMKMRGVKENHSDMTTSIMRGCFRDDSSLKQEFLSHLNNMKGINN